MKNSLSTFFIIVIFSFIATNVNAQSWGGDEQYIKDLYQTFIGQVPDVNAINYYLNELSSGKSRDDIKSEISNSREAASYKFSNGPQVTSFTSQKLSSNSWSFTWVTKKADATVFRLQCVQGIKAYLKDTTTVFSCNDGHSASANGSVNLSFTNSSGHIVTMGARIYPMKNNTVVAENSRTITFSVDATSAPTAPLTPSAPAPTVATSSPKAKSNTSSSPSSKPKTTKTVLPKQPAKIPKIASFVVSDNSSLGKNIKHVSWTMESADGAFLSVSCSPGVVINIITKAKTSRAFDCSSIGQNFSAKDSVDLRFFGTFKPETNITLKLTPAVLGNIIVDKAMTRNFKISM